MLSATSNFWGPLDESVGSGELALASGTGAVGKLLAVVGEDLGDGKWSLVDQTLEEAAGGGG